MNQTLAGSVALLALLTISASASAVDPFEIQVYDGTANPRGAAGLELHVNHVALGLRSADPPELPQHRVTHFTLEPSYGVTDFWEIGGYFQAALRGDGTFDYAGIKLRSKFVTRPGFHPHIRLGLNLELSVLPETYDRNRWAGELRPIVAWENHDWYFAANPIIGTPLAGSGFTAGPTFEPAVAAMFKVDEKFGFGLEYYADFGAIADPAPWRLQQHYLYEIENLLAVKDFELQLGIGEGLTSGSNPLVVKMIVGYVF